MSLTYSYSESVSILSSIFPSKGYTGTHEIEEAINLDSLKEVELTNFCMQLSEKSLAKVWHNEDDEYWASYLND